MHGLSSAARDCKRRPGAAAREWGCGDDELLAVDYISSNDTRPTAVFDTTGSSEAVTAQKAAGTQHRESGTVRLTLQFLVCERAFSASKAGGAKLS